MAKSAQLITELRYVQRGAVNEQPFTRESGPDILGTFRTIDRMNYLTVPVLVKIHFNDRVGSPYLVIGPSLELLLNHHSDTHLQDQVFDNFKKVEMAGNFGIGLKSDILDVEIRYNRSMTSSYKNDVLKVRSTSVEIILGLTL